MGKLEVESPISNQIVTDPVVKIELNSAAIKPNFALVSITICLDFELSLFKLTHNSG